ncbi:MAG: hypothetical protein V1708_00390 [Candidatus Micrarchaeota archaeon]
MAEFSVDQSGKWEEPGPTAIGVQGREKRFRKRIQKRQRNRQGQKRRGQWDFNPLDGTGGGRSQLPFGSSALQSVRLSRKI